MMSDPERDTPRLQWSHIETRRRQIRAGLQMTPAERMAWLEEMLDELLPLVGRARTVEQERTKNRS
jgi:hypothetical protein